MLRNTRLARAFSLALLAALVVATGAASSHAEETPALSGVVNVNTATADELQLLPGIGETRAKAVIAARKERGGFKNVSELLEVKGIGEASLERLRPFATVTGKTTARAK